MPTPALRLQEAISRLMSTESDPDALFTNHIPAAPLNALVEVGPTIVPIR